MLVHNMQACNPYHTNEEDLEKRNWTKIIINCPRSTTTHTLKFTKPGMGGSNDNDKASINPLCAKLFADESDFVFLYVKEYETIVPTNCARPFFSLSDSNCTATYTKTVKTSIKISVTKYEVRFSTSTQFAT